MAYRAIIISSERIMQMPTLTSGPTPILRSVLAKRFSWNDFLDLFHKRDLAHVENDDDDDKAKRSFLDDIISGVNTAGDKIDEYSPFKRDQTQE